MPRVEKAELRIGTVVAGALWRIEVSWVLAVPYWEAGSWCRETVALVDARAGADGDALVRWTSEPWRIDPARQPEDGACFRIQRRAPAQLAGPEVVDVNPDYEGLILSPRFIALVRDRNLDQLKAVVNVQPVLPSGSTDTTAVVAAHFGPAS